jgi:hypothetical protein
MKDTQTPPQQRIKNLSYAAVAGQSGCATVLIIFGALFAGFWLDARLGQDGLCIFGMLILSIPVSLVVMLTIAMNAIARITPPGRAEDDADPHTSSKTEEV